jgi:hypothetical protein
LNTLWLYVQFLSEKIIRAHFLVQNWTRMQNMSNFIRGMESRN